MLPMSSLSPRVPLLAAAGLILVFAGPARATEPPGAAPPPLLTNADLGLSRDELASQGVLPGTAPPAEAPKPPATAEPAPAPKASAPAPEHEIWRSEDETAPASAAETAECHTHLTYEQCMERSIRSGNAYQESNRVCRAVAGAPAS